jgi:hypothetical protein
VRPGTIFAVGFSADRARSIGSSAHGNMLLVPTEMTRPNPRPISRRYIAFCDQTNERTLAWPGRYRRNSRDYELYSESSESLIRISSIHLLLRPLKPDRSMRPKPSH